MDLMSIGSVNNYVKTIDMKNKWNNKKSTGNFKADGITSMSEWVEKQQEKLNTSSYSVNNTDTEQDSDTKLSDIINKYAAGGDLTADEMDYLRQKNPLMYQRVKADKAEQESYEKELKQCRTKDEVQRVKMSHTAASLSAVNSIKNNPNISDGVKLSLMSTESRKLREMDKITLKFVKSGEYAKLPTEEEKLKAEKDIKEAEEAEKNISVSENEIPEETAENTESAEAAEEAEKVTEEIPDEKTADIKEEKAKAEETITESDKKTVAEAEQTPEARKLKHAKFKAYLVSPTSDNASNGISGSSFSGKA